MPQAQRADPCATDLLARRTSVGARLQRELNRYVHCASVIRIPSIIEKVQFAEFGFDLGDGDRGDLWVSIQIVLERVAKGDQKILPA